MGSLFFGVSFSIKRKVNFRSQLTAICSSDDLYGEKAGRHQNKPAPGF